MKYTIRYAEYDSFTPWHVVFVNGEIHAKFGNKTACEEWLDFNSRKW